MIVYHAKYSETVYFCHVNECLSIQVMQLRAWVFLLLLMLQNDSMTRNSNMCGVLQGQRLVSW